MERLAIIVFNITFICFIFWQGPKGRDPFLYIIGGPVCLAFGWYWAETQLVAGIAMSAVGGYLWYLAVRKWMGR